VVTEPVNTADGPTKFRYLPVGPVLDINLVGDMGALFYIDDTGAYTSTPTSDLAQPAFIKISDTQAIVINSTVNTNHAAEHVSLDTLFIAGRVERDWDSNDNLTTKRSYRKTGSVLRHMFTSTYEWDADDTLVRQDVLRIPDGKLLRIDYTWDANGNLVTTDRTLI
jgi:YD repeat-containing protein